MSMERITLKTVLGPLSTELPQWLRELAQNHKSTWEAGSCGGWPDYRKEK